MKRLAGECSLRLRLQEITEGDDIEKHPRKVLALQRTAPHSVIVLSSALLLHDYTCLMHALDLAGREEYNIIAGYGLGRVYAGADFAHWLLDRCLLDEVPASAAPQGALMLYFDHDRFKHAAIYASPGRVVSKWGTGHLYEHAVWEVPASYGQELRYFRPFLYEEAFAHFYEFAREKRVPVDALFG